MGIMDYYRMRNIESDTRMRDTLGKELIRKVYQHPLVHVSHAAKITDASGYVGNFVTQVRSEGRDKTIHHGAVILATGAEEHRPTEYLYGEDDRVWTQLELEERLARDDARLAKARMPGYSRYLAVTTSISASMSATLLPACARAP